MRESMEFDVVIVGAGPAGLSAAIRLMQLSQETGQELTVCVVEKGSEVGAHILSGAILETRALDELLPDWKNQGAPVVTEVTSDQVHFTLSEKRSIKVPNLFIPSPMHNQGNYVISLGNLCRWLGEQAEAMGVEIFCGFSAEGLLFHDNGSVKGVVTGDMGVSHQGEQKENYAQGYELHAKYTFLAEGSRGHLGKQIIEKYQLDTSADAQHYGLGMKELWDINPELHQPGLVLHGAGWPLGKGASGGYFLYHAENNQVVVGLIVDLNYSNPNLSPFEEFQKMKHHPLIAQYLTGASRVSYGARAITKGGMNALPEMVFPGGQLLGCDAGLLNFSKIKGTHTAMKSGMLAAESVINALGQSTEQSDSMPQLDYSERFKASWLYDELYSSRNFGPAMHKLGTFLGGAFNFFDQNIFKGRLPITIRDNSEDYAQMKNLQNSEVLRYAKPDSVFSFDKLSSVFLSNTNHEEDQPCHLLLKDDSIPLGVNLSQFNEPAQRYCPAGVYEIVETDGVDTFQINSQNCLHCKTCDIKDPAQNINWTTPEGGGGPNYPNM